MVVIDTDVFMLEFAFHRHSRFDANSRFLQDARGQSPSITLHNLMEILGQLSFNLQPERLAQWRSWLQEAFDLTVLWPEEEGADAAEFFRREIHAQPLARMLAHRLSFHDALILGVAERAPGVTAFVTWNAKHFRGKTPLSVLTPAEYA